MDRKPLNKPNEGGRRGGLIIGRNPVLEALKAEKPLDCIYICGEGGSLNLIQKLARDRGTVIKQVSQQKLDGMSGGASHQGVIATGACAEYSDIPAILEAARAKNEPPFVIICDEI